MKTLITVFFAMMWLGIGIAIMIKLDDRAAQLDCRHAWWVEPLVMITAPMILGAGLTARVFEIEFETADSETGCIQ